MQTLSDSAARRFYRDHLYMQMANIWACNSRATRAKVGALIVKNGSIISDGYNGMPVGFDNTCEYMSAGRLHTNPEVLHAESNAIVKLARLGGLGMNETAGMYCTYSPCFDCAKMITQVGIKYLHFSQLYRDVKGLRLLDIADVHCTWHVNAGILQSDNTLNSITCLQDIKLSIIAMLYTSNDMASLREMLAIMHYTLNIKFDVVCLFSTALQPLYADVVNADMFGEIAKYHDMSIAMI